MSSVEYQPCPAVPAASNAGDRIAQVVHEIHRGRQHRRPVFAVLVGTVGGDAIRPVAEETLGIRYSGGHPRGRDGSNRRCR